MRLIQHLQSATQFNLLIVGGEAEGDCVRRLSTLVPAARLQLAQNLPLIELARRLARCAGFVGHDSGISHLAAAVRLPVLALWGLTNDVIWRPRGERVTVLRSPEGLQGLSVERVREALGPLLST
jgi:ADP-heptose:LPS heptosyltransferase